MKNTFKKYATGLLIPLLLSSNSYASDYYIQQARSITHIEKRNEAYKTYRLLQILDKDGVFKKIKELDPVNDSLEIRNITDEFWIKKDLQTRPDTPNRNEYKEEIEKRIAYCDQKYSTILYGGPWDMRAEAVILHGIPDVEIEETGPCWIGAGGCDKYYMEWIGKGIKLGFEGKGGYGFPGERSIPHKDIQKDGFEFALMKASDIVNKYVNAAKPEVDIFGDSIKAMKASALSVLSFYNPREKNWTTFINTGISGDKIKDKNDTTKFNLEVLVYDEKGNVLAQNSNNVKALSKYLDDKESWIPLHFPFIDLPKKSTISVSVSKEEKEGKTKKDILVMNYQLPSGSLSDIALSNYKIEQASQITEKNGIKRNDYIIKENPSSTFSLEDVINTYLEVNEITPDSSRNYSYEVRYYLVKLPEAKGKKGEVLLEPLVVIGPEAEDTTKQKLEKLVKEGNIGNIGNFLNTTPFYVETKVSSKSHDHINNALKFPNGSKPGPYALVATVNDNTNVPKVAYRKIYLKPKGNKSY